MQAARAASAKPRRASMRGVRDIEEAGVAGHREWGWRGREEPVAWAA